MIKKNFRTGQLIYAAGLLVAAAGLLIQVLSAMNESIWSDEAFSVALTMLPFRQMLSVIVRDVHPPLYYLSLRLFLALMRLLLPSMSLIATAKLHSVFWLFLLVLLIAAKGRKTLGATVSGGVLLLLFFSAQAVFYGIEIRMYTMAAFFLTGASLAARDLLPSFRASSGLHAKSFTKLILWTLLGSYTNYYACAGSAFLWLYLLAASVVFYFRKSDTEQAPASTLKSLLAAAVCCVLLYLPWLLVALRQAGEVTGNRDYWIEPLSRYTLRTYRDFLFNGSLPFLFALFAAAALFLTMLFTKREALREDFFHALLFSAPLAGILLTGISATLLLRPVFVARYMMPALPAFLTGLAVCFSAFPKIRPSLKTELPLLILFLLCGAVSLRSLASFRAQERNLGEQTVHLTEFTQSLTETDVIVTTNSHYNVDFAFLTDCLCHIYDYEESGVFLDTFPGIRNMKDASEVLAFLSEGRRVFFLETRGGSFSGAAEVFPAPQYQLEHRGDYFLEGNLTVYEVFVSR